MELAASLARAAMTNLMDETIDSGDPNVCDLPGSLYSWLFEYSFWPLSHFLLPLFLQLLLQDAIQTMLAAYVFESIELAILDISLLPSLSDAPVGSFSRSECPENSLLSDPLFAMMGICTASLLRRMWQIPPSLVITSFSEFQVTNYMAIVCWVVACVSTFFFNHQPVGLVVFSIIVTVEATLLMYWQSRHRYWRTSARWRVPLLLLAYFLSFSYRYMPVSIMVPVHTPIFLTIAVYSVPQLHLSIPKTPCEAVEGQPIHGEMRHSRALNLEDDTSEDFVKTGASADGVDPEQAVCACALSNLEDDTSEDFVKAGASADCVDPEQAVCACGLQQDESSIV